jgi:hypothetical protein
MLKFCLVRVLGVGGEGRWRSVEWFDGGRLPVGKAGRQELLSSPVGASMGEGELRRLFEGEELRIMLFNYREMGIIPKVELM